MQVLLCWTFLMSLQVGVEYWDFLKLVKLILISAQIVAYGRLLCGKVLHCQLLIHRTKMCFSKLTSEGKCANIPTCFGYCENFLFLQDCV